MIQFTGLLLLFHFHPLDANFDFVASIFIFDLYFLFQNYYSVLLSFYFPTGFTSAPDVRSMKWKRDGSESEASLKSPTLQQCMYRPQVRGAREGDEVAFVSPKLRSSETIIGNASTRRIRDDSGNETLFTTSQSSSHNHHND